MDIDLIKRYIKGECSHLEAEKVIRWMESPAFDKDLLLAIQEDLNHSLQQDSEAIGQKNVRLKQVLEEIYQRSETETLPFRSHRKLNLTFFVRAAAVVAILITAAWFTLKYTSSRESVPAVANQEIIKENDKGRKSTIFLPDGSVVHLNAESSIRYDEASFNTSRVAYLKGEGFFEVAEDSIHPFMVVVNNLKVVALGTSFNINSYQESEGIAVSLVSGKVLVESKTDTAAQSSQLFLQPGQAVSYLKENKIFSGITAFNNRQVCGWKDGILYFEVADQQAVIRQLERWFGVEFEFRNQSPTIWRYTAQFQDESLKNILESMSFSQKFNYVLDGKKVIVDFQ
jgi:ferric-dicitrate binding protein FerR (iron transport regulator)